MNGLINGKTLNGGQSISIGDLNNILPDTPQNILLSGRYNKSIPIITGTTKDDGDYVATGDIWLPSTLANKIIS